MAQKKRIRECPRVAKEFPKYRGIIEKEGWAPHLLCDSVGTYWDGFTLIDSKGEFQNAVSEACRKQIVNMILDGYFGEEAKDAFLDHMRYEKIFDALTPRPNQDMIAREGLRVLDVRRKGSREN
jgi:hypothetical protein